MVPQVVYAQVPNKQVVNVLLVKAKVVKESFVKGQVVVAREVPMTMQYKAGSHDSQALVTHASTVPKSKKYPGLCKPKFLVGHPHPRNADLQIRGFARKDFGHLYIRAYRPKVTCC